MNKKVIFIDIDGTIINSKEQMTDRTINALKNAKEAGHTIVFCTGRSINRIQSLPSHELFDYFVYANGAGIFDNKNEVVIFTKPVSKREILGIYSKVATNSEIVSLFVSGEHRYSDSDENIFSCSETPITAPETFINNNKIVQYVILSGNPTPLFEIKPYLESRKKIRIAAMSRHLQDTNNLATKWMFIDAVHKKSSKGYGIKQFCKMFKIKIENTIGIGDDINDMPMFDVVGYKVAMGNAIDQLKQRADHITKSNDEDGVAVFLETIS